jgi:hypothetical protein
MGCDGGTIPKRSELVKPKRKKEEKDKDSDLAAKWQYCALSSTQLEEPIVACELGRLYNKEAVIEYLLSRKDNPNEEVAHIRSLKDVTELKLTRKKVDDSIKSSSSAMTGGEYVDMQDSRFICPVVGLEMSGKYKFCYISQCGCVISERALKEVKSDTCHGCGRQYEPQQDAIVINGSPEEVEQLRTAMEERRAKLKNDKKSRKKQKTEELKEDAKKDSEQSITESSSSNKKRKDSISLNGASSTSSEKRGSSSSSSTAKTSATSMLNDKSRSDYSVAKDPNASETYKSLFTTHSSAKNKPKGNWVTYNPLYF